jgi:hypothetical protein
MIGAAIGAIIGAFSKISNQHRVRKAMELGLKGMGLPGNVIDLRSPGKTTQFDNLARLAGGAFALYKPITGRGEQGQWAQNALINQVLGLNLASEDSRGFIKKFLGGMLGQDAQDAFWKITEKKQLGKVSMTEFKDTIQGMVEAFYDLPNAIDAADLAALRGGASIDEDLPMEMQAIDDMYVDEMTDDEQDFAALAEPKDKITYADKIAGATRSMRENKLSIERAINEMDVIIDSITKPRKKKVYTLK